MIARLLVSCSVSIIPFPPFFAAISINGNRVYELGETSNIICSTEVPVPLFEWFDESSRIVINRTSILALVIEAKHNNSMFTCQVNHGAFMGSRTIIIITGREFNL